MRDNTINLKIEKSKIKSDFDDVITIFYIHNGKEKVDGSSPSVSTVYRVGINHNFF